MKRHNFRWHEIFVLALFLIVGCTDHQITRWKIPGEMQKKDLVLLRRFNMSIIEFDGINVAAPPLQDIAVLPGEHALIVQPEMWVSTFPPGKHLEERKQLRFKADAGQCVYLCLGLLPNHSWSPFVVIVRQRENPRDALLAAMESKSGCFSSNKSIPVIWLKQ